METPPTPAEPSGQPDGRPEPTAPPRPPRVAGLAFRLAAAVPVLLLVPLSMFGKGAGLAGILSMQLAILLPTLLWVASSGLQPLRWLRLAPAPSAPALGLGVVTGLTAMVAGAGLHGLTQAALPRSILDTFDLQRRLAPEQWSPWLLLLVISIVPAVCEEVTFRGGLLSGLIARRSPRWAIGLSSLVFAVYHLDPVRFPGVLLLGGVYGWLAWRTGSIWPSMLAHAINNGVGVIGLLLVAESGQAGADQALAPAAALLALGLGLGGLALLERAARGWLPPAPAPSSFLVALAPPDVAPRPPLRGAST